MEYNTSISLVSTAVYAINENDIFDETNNESIKKWFVKGVPNFYCAKDMFVNDNGNIQSRNIPHSSCLEKINSR